MDYCSYAGAVDVTVILHFWVVIVNVIVARLHSCVREEREEGYDRARASGDAKRSSRGNRGKSSKPKSAYKLNKGMGSKEKVKCQIATQYPLKLSLSSSGRGAVTLNCLSSRNTRINSLSQFWRPNTQLILL